jgi:hypothetical protein
MGVEDNVSQQLQPLFEDPPEWKLPQQQKDELYKAQNKVKGLKAIKPLPEGYSTVVSQPWRHVYTKDGHLLGGMQSVFLTHNGNQVGEVNWDPLNGDVKWVGVDDEHRVIGTHHLLNAAHEWAAKEGGLGPFRSENLSSHSASLMKRFVPSSITPDTHLPSRNDLSYSSANLSGNEDRDNHPIAQAIDSASTSLFRAHRALAEAYSNPTTGEVPDDSPAWKIADHLNNVHDMLDEARDEFHDGGNPTNAVASIHRAADALENHPAYSPTAPHGPAVGFAINHLRRVS